MNNQRQAAQEVYYILKNSLGLENELSKKVATRIAQTLNQAGLITPDRPEPSRGMTSPNGKVWYLDGPIGDIRRTGEDIVVFGHDYRHQSLRLILTKAETENIALALLAAAQYAEEA